MSRYNNVISLGAWCQVSYQINRRYDRKSGGPFEWNVAPWSAMTAILRDGTERLAQQLIVKEDAASAKCLEYGVLLPHDFPKHLEKHVILSAEKILQTRSKYRHKFEKMIRSISEPGARNLFIRMGGGAETGFAWPYLFDGARLENQDIVELVDIVKQRCRGNDFAILIVQDSIFCHESLDKTMLPRNVFVADIAGCNDTSRWEGSDEVWDRIFDFVESPGGKNFISLKD